MIEPGKYDGNGCSNVFPKYLPGSIIASKYLYNIESVYNYICIQN